MVLSDTVAGIIVGLVVIGVLTPITIRMYLLQRKEDRNENND
jgi:hypothetical protein